MRSTRDMRVIQRNKRIANTCGVRVMRHPRNFARLVVLVAAALVATPSGVSADTSSLVISARAQGMGGAFSAVSNDASATFWNPAGMTLLPRTEIMYSHWELSDVSNVGVDFAALAVPFDLGNMSASLGFSFTRVGAQLEEGPNGTTHGISDNRLSLSGGLRLAQYVSVGMSLSRIEVSANRGSGAGFGFDAAVLVQPFADYDVRFAAVGRNLSGDVKNEDLDQSWRIGGAGSFWEHRIMVSADANLRRDINGHDGVSGLYYAGLEVTPMQQFSLRVGGGSQSQYGAGFGVRHRGLAFDYAFSDDDEVLGTSHRFSVSVGFGPGGFGDTAAQETR